MTGTPAYDIELYVSRQRATDDPPRVLHPCRCDAPDPEATRWLPIQVDGAALLRDGAYTYECPDCAYVLHAVLGE